MKKRFWALLILMLPLLTAQALAQETMNIYVAEGALPDEAAKACVSLLQDAFPQAQWTLLTGGEELRRLVMADNAPQIAICAPQEALVWAREGLLAPLDGCVPEIGRMHYTVVDACVSDESLFMAPLLAEHRRMAVNRDLMREANMDYMMNATEHPVWFPSELYQVMDAFFMQDITSFDLWRPTPENIGGIEAFAQAIYGGALLSDDAAVCLADSPEISAGAAWLQNMMEAGMVGYAQDRETALERFLIGETAIFMDWTRVEEQRKPEFELVTMPYPASCGLPVRSFDVTGIAVFAGEGESLALSAMAYLTSDERALGVIGERGIFADEAIWLPCISASEMGATLRGQLSRALAAVFEEGTPPEEELKAVAAAMNTMTE